AVGDRRAVRLQADRVDHRVRATPVGELAYGCGQVVTAAQVEGGDAVALGHREALGNQVDADDLLGATVPGDARAQLADRAQAEHDDRAPGRYVGVLQGLPGGGHDVGQVQVALVGFVVVGHHHRPDIGEGHP